MTDPITIGAFIILALSAFVIWQLLSEIDRLKESDIRAAETISNLQAEKAYDAETIRFLREEIKPFDHDHDGKAGGSIPKSPTAR